MDVVPPNEADDLWALRERAKELRCLYSVISALSRREEPPNVVFSWILEAIPPAWQYPEDTTARIEYFGRTHALNDFVDTPWQMRSPISIWRTQVGASKSITKANIVPPGRARFFAKNKNYWITSRIG